MIRKMTASFGCLDGKTLELHDGLNVVEAKNESGKSTWCAFIRAMLYGIDSSQREKNGIKPDKVKYAPWSGAPMQGEMDVEYGGMSITLSRRTKTASAPMRDFSAVYTSTARPVDGLRGTDAGETLTGLTRGVFESSAFIGQSAMRISGSAELEKRINAIVSTGEEGESFSQADEQLRAWQRKRRFRRSGAIPELEEQEQELRRRLEQQREAIARRAELERRLEQQTAEAERLAEASAAGDTARRERLTQQLADCRAAIGAAQSAASEKTEAAIAKKAALEAGRFGLKTGEELRREAEDDIGAMKKLYSGIFSGKIALIICLAAVILAAGLIALLRPAATVAAGIVLVVFVIAGGYMLTRSRILRGLRGHVKVKYGASDVDGIEAVIAQQEKALSLLRAAEREAETARGYAEELRFELDGLEKQLLEQPRPAADAPDASVRAEAERLCREIAQLEGRFEVLGDPMVLETQLGELEARRAELEEQYDAIALAIDTLGQADAELQQRFSPALGKKATEYMSILTGGRYDRLSFDKALSARARLSGDTADHETAFLSAGAASQVYLALRLAICALALPEDSNCPLILDDALCDFDGERMARALDLLGEIAKTRQVILFTCQDRERRYLDGKTEK